MRQKGRELGVGPSEDAFGFVGKRPIMLQLLSTLKSALHINYEMNIFPGLPGFCSMVVGYISCAAFLRGKCTHATP